MRNTKKELFIFSASDIDAMEKHFEEMASKGWMLDEVGEYMVKYKRTEPQKKKFSIDLFPKLSIFDHPDKDEVLEYRSLCIDAGWQFIDSSYKFQVFAAAKDKNLPPIQTDDRIKQSIINKSLIFEIIILAISLGIFIWSLDKLFPLYYRAFDSNIDLVMRIAGPIMIIPTTAFIVTYTNWMVRAKISIKKEKPLPKTSYRAMRLKNILFIYLTLLVILLATTAVLLDIVIGNFKAIMRLLPTIIGFTVGTLFRKNKNKKKRDKAENIGLFILVLVFMVIGMSIIMPTIRHKTESKELKEEYKGLEFSDFNLPYPELTEFSKGGSIILPKYSTYYEVYLGKDGYSLNTEYYKAKSNKTAKYILNSIIEEYSERYNIIFADEFSLFDEAYYAEESNRLILLKDMEIFIIRSSIDIWDEENIKIITDKLLY